MGSGKGSNGTGAKKGRPKGDGDGPPDVDTSGYPYPDRMERREHEKAKLALQVELPKAQRRVRDAEQKVVIPFDGRDAAGKGGTTERFTEHLNPRAAKIVKSDDEKRARIDCMRRFPSSLPYPDRDEDVVGAPDPLVLGPAPAVPAPSPHAVDVARA